MAQAEKSADRIELVANNRRASYDWELEEHYEAGLVLTGSEVKSLRNGRLNFKDSYIQVRSGEAYWIGAHISGYAWAHQFDHDPERVRKLLLHKSELRRLMGKVREKGLSLVPLKLYLKNGRFKLELALARGKKAHDRRHDIKAKDAAREVARALRARR